MTDQTPRNTANIKRTMSSSWPSMHKRKTWVRTYFYDIVWLFLSHHPATDGLSAWSSLHLLWHGHLWWDREGWEGDSLWWHLFLSFWFENDSKVTLEAQLGLIGGTMGLLTGFSILSGVEIIYFVLRFLWFSLRTSYSAGFSCHSRFENLRWWLRWNQIWKSVVKKALKCEGRILIIICTVLMCFFYSLKGRPFIK